MKGLLIGSPRGGKQFLARGGELQRLARSAKTNYDELPIPFRCVATDLSSMEPVVFQAGPLPQAVRASISIPGIFRPVEFNGHYLVDAAITNNLPSDIVRQELHADVVVGVQLDAPIYSEIAECSRATQNEYVLDSLGGSAATSDVVTA